MHSNAARNAHDVVLREVLARTSPGRVLDAPCGGGALASRLADAGYRVLGLDIDPLETHGKFEFRRADLSARLPLADGEADTVVSVEGIEHLERPFEFVRECGRVLRDHGLLIVTTPNISSLRSRWRWFLTGFHHKAKYALDETRPSPMHHINMLSYHSLRYMLHTNGFLLEAVTTNRIKPVSWLYAAAVPLVYTASRLNIAHARPQEINRAISLDVLGHMMSRDVLFGELLVMIARKTGASTLAARGTESMPPPMPASAP